MAHFQTPFSWLWTFFHLPPDSWSIKKRRKRRKSKEIKGWTSLARCQHCPILQNYCQKYERDGRVDEPGQNRLWMSNWRCEGIARRWGGVGFWIQILNSKAFVWEVWLIGIPIGHVITTRWSQDPNVWMRYWLFRFATCVTLKLFSSLPATQSFSPLYHFFSFPAYRYTCPYMELRGRDKHTLFQLVEKYNSYCIYIIITAGQGWI